MRVRVVLGIIAALAIAVGSASGEGPSRPLSREVDPDGLMHGLRFGATEAQVIATLGPPTGVLQLTESRKAVFYGKSHAFVLRNGAFRELQIERCLFDWELARNMDDHPFLNARRWSLKPGVLDGMTFREVASLLKLRDARPDYQVTYETDHATVTLHFSGSVNGHGPDDFELMGIRIQSLEVQ